MLLVQPAFGDAVYRKDVYHLELGLPSFSSKIALGPSLVSAMEAVLARRFRTVIVRRGDGLSVAGPVPEGRHVVIVPSVARSQFQPPGRIDPQVTAALALGYALYDARGTRLTEGEVAGEGRARLQIIRESYPRAMTRALEALVVNLDQEFARVSRELP